jgi:hypothetical protein
VSGPSSSHELGISGSDKISVVDPELYNQTQIWIFFFFSFLPPGTRKLFQKIIVFRHQPVNENGTFFEVNFYQS